MKKLILAALISLAPSITLACDLCNCYLTFNPHDLRNSIGFRYRYSIYHGAGEREYFSTYEAWGRWYPIQRLQVDFIVPFRHNVAIEDETHSITGVGDLVALAQYEIYSDYPTGDRPFHQRLSIGGGIKAPTGKYKVRFENEPIDQHIQPGSGSTDFLLTGTYLAKYNRVGLSANATYGLNTTNSYGFRFANRLNLSSSVFYQLGLGSLTVMPNLGLYFEKAKQDRLDHAGLDNTGGTMVLGTLGLDIFSGNYAFSLGFQRPVIQHTGPDQTKNRQRFTAGLHYSFESRSSKMF